MEVCSEDFSPHYKQFDHFRQAEVPSRYSPGGVRIGLEIARHLVELHGGTIEVASEREGRGATFTLKLPLVLQGNMAKYLFHDTVKTLINS